MALVSLALAHAGAHAQTPSPFANPLYRQWVGFAVGTSVTFTDQRWVVGQRGSQHVVTQQLVSSSPDEIVVTWTSRPSWARRTAHFDVFTADSTGSYTVEQNFLEINTELNTLCLEPGDCDRYATWAMNAHAGDGVNDLKTCR